MGKRTFQTRMCITCDKPYTPTGPSNRWCSLLCRLTDQIDSSGGPDACWPWKASLDKNGYGEIRLKRNAYTNEIGVYEDGTYFAHRIALEVLGGVSVSDSDVVRHTCDSPSCCRPAHLVIGTQADNVRDMISRGRQQDYRDRAKGEDHWAAKITAKIAIAIFDSPVVPYKKIATQYGITESMVQRIKAGRTWAEVTGAKFLPTGHRLGERHGRAKLTEDDVRVIRSSPVWGRTLAQQFGVTEQLISHIRKRKLWKHVE